MTFRTSKFFLLLSTDPRPTAKADWVILVVDTGKIYRGLVNGSWTETTSGGGAIAWGDIGGLLSAQTDLQNALNGKQPAGSYAAASHDHAGVYEPANANIQAHVAQAHAPANAQKNSDILKTEIEAILTGVISSHSHAGGGGATIASARVTTNRTTTSTAMGNITDLAIAMPAGETWSFEAELHAGCNNTGGSQFSITVPAGATLKVRAFGNTNSATAWTSGQIAASDGASPTMLNISAQGRRVKLAGVVVNGANAGNIQARFKSVTNGQTTTVEANSYMTGRRH